MNSIRKVSYRSSRVPDGAECVGGCIERRSGKIIFFIIMLSVCGTTIVCQDYEQQVASDPDDYAALYNAGVTAFKQNQLEKAQRCFDVLKMRDFSKNEREGEQVFYNAGNSEVKLKRYEEALASFEKVLAFNPHNDVARKKIEHIKALLQKQKQEEQSQKDTQDTKDKQQEKQQKQNEKDPEKQDQKEKQGDADRESDAQTAEEQKASHDQEQAQTPEKNEEIQEQPDPEEKKLTEQEKQLLAYVNSHDEKMHEHMEKKKLQKAQGAMNVRNNW